jgi:hypothetical protein
MPAAVLIELIISVILIFSCNDGPVKKYKPVKTRIQWTMLDKGLYYTEIATGKKTIVGDGKLSILKINPTYYSFELHTASALDSVPRTVEEWSVEKNLAAVINAGMYNLHNRISSTGFMKNFDHVNNGNLRSDYKCVAAFNRVNSKVPEFMIADLEHDDWSWINKQYNSFSQCIRMIDCNQKMVQWKPRIPISCSMCVMATDIYGNVLFIFTRSPYTANTISVLLLSLPLHIYNAMYLEGGPESSLYINAGDTVIEKVGSYVSRTWARDDNDHFYRLPNVIGVKRK